MKTYFYSLMIITVLVLVSCSTEKDFAPSSLLSPEEGKFTLVIVFSETQPTTTNQLFYEEIYNEATKKEIIHEIIITTDPDKYNLEIEPLPAVAIIGTKGVELKTNDIDKAMQFIEDKS